MALTDRRVAQLGRRLRQLKDEAKANEAAQDELTRKLLAELDRRNTTLIETNGVRLVKVTSTQTVYEWAEFAERLPPRTMAQLRPDKVDAAKLAEAMASGKVPRDVAAAATHLRYKSAYITPTILVE